MGRYERPSTHKGDWRIDVNKGHIYDLADGYDDSPLFRETLIDHNNRVDRRIALKRVNDFLRRLFSVERRNA